VDFLSCADDCSGNDTCDLDVCEAACKAGQYNVTSNCLAAVAEEACAFEATSFDCISNCWTDFEDCSDNSNCDSGCQTTFDACIAACPD
jgi:hypothetical protein